MKLPAHLSAFAVVLALTAGPAMGADDAPVTGAPGAPPATGLPGLPSLPMPGIDMSAMTSQLPAMPAAVTNATNGMPGLEALTNLVGTTDSVATATAAGVAIQLNAFLFRDDETLGKVNRERMDLEEAEKVRANEIEKYKEKYRNDPQFGGQAAGYGGYPGAYQGYGDPNQFYQQQQREAQVTAGAEFDFYYQQLELYNRYLREVLLRGVSEEDMPDEPSYDAANLATEAVTLQQEFEKAAIALVNQQQEENSEFIERLQEREDRRLAFERWVDGKKQELFEWTEIWARNVNGQRWIGGDTTVRLNDWYQGLNVASPKPVLFTVDGNKFLVSRTPQHDVPEDTLNILSTNLTPFDLVDRDGNVKDVATERLRGTAVRAPIATPRTGTIIISD